MYLNYGMHFLVNAVTEAEGRPAAVLIRALAPLDGIDAMRERFATLEDTESALTVGDFARIDIAAYDGDDEIPGLSASDFTYEVGSGI